MDSKVLFSSPDYLADNEELEKGEISLNYIVSEQLLQTLLNNACAEIKYPMTIVQWNKNIPRIDSILPMINLRPSCENFRIAGGTKFCVACDKSYASLFTDLSDTNIDAKIKERIRKREYSQTLEQGVNSIPEFIKTEYNYGYLQYNCPMMGYRELIFPIIFEHKVIGVFFIGQIRLQNADSKRIRKRFFSKNPQIFDEYMKKSHTVFKYLTRKWILHTIEKTQSRSRKILRNYLGINNGLVGEEIPDLLSDKQYKDLIKKVIVEIKKINDHLCRYMQEKRESYIRNIINQSCSMFYQDRVNEHISVEDSRPPYEILRKFWNSVALSYNYIYTKLGLEYIAFFGVDSFGTNGVSQLNLVSYVPQVNADVIFGKEYNAKQIAFDIKKVEMSSSKAITSLDDSRLLEALVLPRKLVGMKNKLLILFPVPDRVECSVAMLVSFTKETDIAQQGIINSLVSNLIINGTAIFSTFVSCMVRLSEASTNRMLRIYRHEITHVSLGLKHIHDFRLKNATYIRGLSDEKIELIRKDYGSALAQLKGLSNNVQILFGAPYIVHNEKFDDDVKVFQELIYKWREMYSKQLAKRMLCFVTPRLSLLYNRSAPYSVDMLLLDQIMYNLIDNAMKYSYWGTNIHIDCARPTEADNGRILSITSFGVEMENSEEPFKLFSRGFNIDDKATGGAGIGLYIVSELSKKLGGKVLHKSTKISSLNVPLLDVFLNREDIDRSRSDIVDTAKIELDRLCNSTYLNDELMEIERLRPIVNIYDDVVSKGTIYNNSTNQKDIARSMRYSEFKHIFDNIPVGRIMEQIVWATYKTTFEVTI